MPQATATDHQRAAVLGDLALTLANRVLVACAELGVVVMPLKGTLFLASWPDLRGQRDLVDVDLLVRPADFRSVTSALRTLGFEPTIRTSVGGTFVSDAWPLSVDLHHTLFPHGLFRASTEGIFARAEPDESLFAVPIARMADEDVFAHLIGHFVKGRGTFLEDKSLDDLRWMLSQGMFQLQDADRLAAHLLELGLQRSAGYALDDDRLRDQPVIRAVIRSLGLSNADRIAVAAARAGTRSNRGAPRWWTPHLLDQSLAAGFRSLLAHANEGVRRLVGHINEQFKLG